MQKKLILVIDDDPEVRLSLNIRLKANNYDVIVAEDGVSSIAQARKHQPDLIILDLGIPAGDGFSVLERLRANATMALIPVIVLSGRDRVANAARTLQAGAKVFLQKPVDNVRLLTAIRQIFGERSASAVYELTDPNLSTAPVKPR